MTRDPSILVVAATAAELAEELSCATLRCGVGPVDAGAQTAAWLAAEAAAGRRPRALLHVGVAGARRAGGPPLRAVVIGTQAIYTDLGVPEQFAPHAVAADATLLTILRRNLPQAHALPIATVARVGGSAGSDCLVEAMEGFAVLRAAQLAEVPAVEVRVISNEIEEQDRRRWILDESFAALRALTPALVNAVSALPVPGAGALRHA